MNPRSSLLWTAALLTLMLAGPALAQDEFEAPASMPESSRPGAARPGWIMSLYFTGTQFDLDDDIVARFAELDIDLEDQAQGAGLSVGYSFSNRFSIEMELGGGRVATGNDDIEAGLAEFGFSFRVPLMPEERVSPYLQGFLGGTALFFEGDSIDDRVFVGGSTGFGGGVEVHLSRRWAFDLGYRYTLTHFDNEELETSEGDKEIDIDGSGNVHQIAARAVFSF